MYLSGSSQVFSLSVAAVAAKQHVVVATKRTSVRESVPAPQDLDLAACRAGLHTTTPTPRASNQSPTSEQCPLNSHVSTSQIDVSSEIVNVVDGQCVRR